MAGNKRWISLVALVLAVACAGGCALNPQASQEEVFVYSYDMVGYVNFYQSGTESYGMVTTDRVQSAFVSPTQQVTDILVYQGQQVQKGDVLYRYDTTISDLELERKDLEIQQMEMNLKNAQSELTALKKMKPMVLPDEPDKKEEDKKTDDTVIPKEAVEGKIYNADSGNGSTLKPYYVWLSGLGTSVTEEMIYEYFTARDASLNSGDFVYVIFRVADSAGEAYEKEYGMRYALKAKTVTDGFAEVFKGNADVPAGDDTSSEPTEVPTVVAPVLDPAAVEISGSYVTLAQPENIPEGYTVKYYISLDGSEWTAGDGGFSGLDSDTEYYFRGCFVDAAGNESASGNILKVRTDETKLTIEMRFYDPSSRSQAHDDDDEIEWNSGYTYSELVSMRNEKSAQIEQLKFDIKMGKAELKIMRKEADSGEVVAEFDGVVASVLEPANAVAMNAPLIKVAGGGGFYVEGSVSELDLATIQVGQTVTVTSWETNMTYDGTVVEVGSYPTEDDNNFSYGSTNVSFYPYKVFIDETADLQEGYYVSMTYQSEPKEEGTMYLENAFLRSENAEHYVYVRGIDGLLEKRTVQIGDSSDGYMTEIVSGLSETDYLAFPYGKAIAEGVPTVEGTWEDLYGY